MSVLLIAAVRMPHQYFSSNGTGEPTPNAAWYVAMVINMLCHYGDYTHHSL